jgi:hypothetical protein
MYRPEQVPPSDISSRVLRGSYRAFPPPIEEVRGIGEILGHSGSVGSYSVDGPAEEAGESDVDVPGVRGNPGIDPLLARMVVTGLEAGFRQWRDDGHPDLLDSDICGIDVTAPRERPGDVLQEVMVDLIELYDFTIIIVTEDATSLFLKGDVDPLVASDGEFGQILPKPAPDVAHQTTLLASFPFGLVPVAPLVGVHHHSLGTGRPFPVRDSVVDNLGDLLGSGCGAQHYCFRVLAFTLSVDHDVVDLGLPGVKADGSPLVR